MSSAGTMPAWTRPAFGKGSHTRNMVTLDPIGARRQAALVKKPEVSGGEGLDSSAHNPAGSAAEESFQSKLKFVQDQVRVAAMPAIVAAAHTDHILLAAAAIWRGSLSMVVTRCQTGIVPIQPSGIA
jgi:hypothetical protein